MNKEELIFDFERKIELENYLRANGNVWDNNNFKRIYFSHRFVNESAGLYITTYSTGNISSANFNGSKISNSKASKLAACSDDKFFYDLLDGSFSWKADNTSDEVFELAISNINGKFYE